MKSNLSTCCFLLLFLLMFLVSDQKRYCQIQGNKNLHLVSSRSLIILALNCKHLIYLELILCTVWDSLTSLFCMLVTSCPIPFVEKSIFPHGIVLAQVSKVIKSKCMAWFLDSQYHSLDLYFYLYSSITLFIVVTL
jgi:hypothetical protein